MHLSFLLMKKTGSATTIFILVQRWIHTGAPAKRLWTSSSEPASGGNILEGGKIFIYQLRALLSVLSRLREGYRAEEHPGIWMKGILKDIIYRAMLDDPSQVHDVQIIAYIRDHPHIVRNNENG
jgi:hypothetical protein